MGDRHSKPSEVRDPREAGFGLVEIMISMFLLMILSAAFLPLLIDALKTTVRNATAATATQLASEQLDAVGLLPRTCAALAAFEAAVLPDVSDERGVTYSSHRDAAACPTSGYPVAVNVRVWVTVDNDPGLRIESKTTVIVESAS